jgi:glucan 1,3-beta-glucosidase
MLEQHWRSFIQQHDFAWLASIGINAVRIPVGHWLFAQDYPYHSSYGEVRYPYASGGLRYLDLAFDWAEALGLVIMLDLHAAPGCQNGFDNGGIKDSCDWHTQAAYQAYALEVLEQLAARYGKRPALHSIEVLNEPHWTIDTELLKTFTATAYQRIRQHCPVDTVAVVFHDAFRSYHAYDGFMPAPAFQNVLFDIHRYQCFVQEDVDRDLYQHLIKAADDWKQEADSIIKHTGRPTVVGEWSLGLHPQFMTLWQQQAMDCAGREMDDFQLDIAYRGYAAAQLACFEKYQGWFFWSYKTETMPQWSFTDCVARGWLPNRFN